MGVRAPAVILLPTYIIYIYIYNIYIISDIYDTCI